MQYLLIGVIMALYFEFLGQTIVCTLKIRKPKFSLSIGFLSFLFVFYILTMFISGSDGNFFYILGIFILLILSGLFLIIKNIKRKCFSLDLKFSIIAIALISFLTYFAFNTSLGDPDGFDYLTYINTVVSNAGLKELNSISFFNGTTGFTDWTSQYSYTSFYYFASCVVYLATRILSIIGIESFSMPVYVWAFQILLNCLWVTLLLNIIDLLLPKKYGLQLLVISLFVFYYGKLYFMNVYGFFGNSYRMVIYSDVMMYLYLYIDNNKNEYLWLSVLLAASACAASSTHIFMYFMFVFGLFYIVIDKYDNFFKLIGIFSLFPLINLWAVIRDPYFPVPLKFVFFSIVVCLLLFVFNKPLNTLFKNKYIKFLPLFLITGLLTYESFKSSGKIINFEPIFNNMSQVADMTVDYFDFNNRPLIQVLFSIICLQAIVVASICNIKDRNHWMLFILVISFFGPLTCTFLNSLVNVYYRAYDLVLNPFTVSYCLLFEDNLLKKLALPLELCFAVCLIITCNITSVNYYHKSFIPDSTYKYNAIYKMSDADIEMIKEIKGISGYYQNFNPLIITSNKLTQSTIGYGMYFYGRNMHGWADEPELSTIFHPLDLTNNYTRNLSYDKNLCEYLKTTKTNYLVVENGFAEQLDNGSFSDICYHVQQCGYDIIYETEKNKLYVINE